MLMNTHHAHITPVENKCSTHIHSVTNEQLLNEGRFVSS